MYRVGSLRACLSDAQYEGVRRQEYYSLCIGGGNVALSAQRMVRGRICHELAICTRLTGRKKREEEWRRGIAREPRTFRQACPAPATTSCCPPAGSGNVRSRACRSFRTLRSAELGRPRHVTPPKANEKQKKANLQTTIPKKKQEKRDSGVVSARKSFPVRQRERPRNKRPRNSERTRACVRVGPLRLRQRLLEIHCVIGAGVGNGLL